MDLLRVTARLVRQVTEQVMEHSPEAVTVVVTNPLETMTPATGVEEKPEEKPADKPEPQEPEDSKEEQPKTDDEAYNRMIRSLEVLEEKRADDFKAACTALNIPLKKWKDAPDEWLEKLIAELD